MLHISNDIVGAFSRDASIKLMQRIDVWLLGVTPAWRTIAPERRQRELGDVVMLARDSGMSSERDVSVFAWICAMLGPDWRARMSAAEVASMLASPEWDCEAKLMRLDEIFRLTEATQRQGAAA